MIRLRKISCFQAVLWLLLALLSGSTSQAYASSTTCYAQFAKLRFEQPFQTLQAGLYDKLRAAYPKDAERIIKNIESLYFIDDAHQRSALASLFLNKSSLEKERLYTRYNTVSEDPVWNKLKRLFGSRKPAEAINEFDNFQRAREVLRTGEISTETFLRAHAKAMEGGIENIPRDKIGQFRNNSVVGIATDKGVAKSEYEEIIRNPYLGFEVSRKTDDRVYGKILYPTPENVSPQILDRIWKRNPALAQDIQALRDTLAPASSFEAYHHELIRTLTDERFDWFIRQKNQIGPLDIPENSNAYIRLVTELQRDLVAIHPFANGNGRTTRALLYAFLEKEGLPPPRLFDTFADIQTGLDDWVFQVKSGMIATARLYEDLSKRIKFELPLSDSPELFTPMTPRAYQADFKVYGKKVVMENHTTLRTDSNQYGAWLRERFREDPGALANYTGTARQLADEYTAFAKAHNLVFDHPKEGVRNISLNFVDQDFKTLFERNLASDTLKWKSKMERWYKPDLVWRGLSYRDREVADGEILDMFRKLHPQMVSNEAAKSGMDPKKLAEAVQADFTRYNKDLYGNQMQNMARDHSETGPMYGNSYGYSTSKRREVGKAFAMGAMVIAEYGKHQEVQHLLKSRILIGAYRANKDVDLGRLHQFKDDFIYKYPRQSEVMGIGGAEPDSIMVVQRIGPDGGTIESFVRNPENPSQVWKVRGEYQPEAGKAPLPEQILETIDLFFPSSP